MFWSQKRLSYVCDVATAGVLNYILNAHCYGLVFWPPTNGLNEQLTAN